MDPECTGICQPAVHQHRQRTFRAFILGLHPSPPPGSCRLRRGLTSLGAAGGALVSVSIPAGNEGAEHMALKFMIEGFKAFLGELRKGQAN